MATSAMNPSSRTPSIGGVNSDNPLFVAPDYILNGGSPLDALKNFVFPQGINDSAWSMTGGATGATGPVSNNATDDSQYALIPIVDKEAKHALDSAVWKRIVRDGTSPCPWADWLACFPMRPQDVKYFLKQGEVFMRKHKQILPPLQAPLAPQLPPSIQAQQFQAIA